MPAQEQSDPSHAVTATAEAIAATVGLVAGGPVGAVIGGAVTPYVLEVVQRSWEELAGRRRHSVATMVATAAEHLGEDPQRMVDLAFSVEQGPELLADAMHAAAATLNERKVTALARAVSNGLADDQAAIDEERLVVQALAAIDEAHLGLLLAMATRHRSGAWSNQWHPHDALLRRMKSDGLLRPLLQTLERHGLVEENLRQQDEERAKRARELIDLEFERIETLLKDRSRFRPRPQPTGRPDPIRTWRVTLFGNQVLDHLEHEASRTQESAPQTATEWTDTPTRVARN